MKSNSEALLTSDDRFTIFSFGNCIIRFKAPYSLEKYTKIKEWDNGYIVVMAKYKHNSEDKEEFIDLIPILKDLYMEPDKFLKPIKKVRIVYD